MSTSATLGTRQRLLRAAQELIEQGGYSAATVAAIAERAGFAPSTLYRHFTSKEELFVELFRAVCDRELEAMQAAAGEPSRATGAAGDPGASPAAAAKLGGELGHPERLETVLSTFAERALRRPRLAWALIAEPVDPLVDAERLAYRARYAGLVAESLRAAMAADELPEQNAELVAAALVGGCGEALVGPLSPLAAERPTAAEVVQALRTFVRRAIGRVV